MVTNDYGKLAYLKIAELEKKIQVLEGKVNESNYTELEFNYNNLTSKYTHTFSVTVNALKDGLSTVKLVIEAAPQQTIYGVEVKVNGVTLYNNTETQSVKNSFSLEATLNKGENVISVSVANSNNSFAINSLKLSVSGFVEYLKTKNYLSNVTVNEADYVLHLKNDVALLFSYSLITGLVNCYTLNNVLDCKIVGALNNVLYIAFIDVNNNLFVLGYNLTTGEDSIMNLNVSACSSVAGYPCGDGVKLYYSRFAKIYCGVYMPNQPFYPQYTGRKGLEVYADSNAPNAIVIVDNFLNAKFVTD